MTASVLEETLLLPKVQRFMEERGIETYLVGGYVRDSLLGRPANDVDIAVRADAPHTAKSLAEFLGGRYVPLDEHNQVVRVVVVEEACKYCLDFSGYRESIETDLDRRDFTIDAMAVDISRWQVEDLKACLVDPFDGLVDLEMRKLRAVSDNVFHDDPIRLLRGVRLTGELGLVAEPHTETLMRRDAGLIGRVPGERVREELIRLLALPETSSLLRYLDELDMLMIICPELETSRGFRQPVEHHWEVFEHSLHAVKAVEFLLHRGTWEYGDSEILSLSPWSEILDRHFVTPVAGDSDRAMILKMAALFHDVAKPQTKTVAENGCWRFLGHAKLGATIARSAMERLRFSNREAWFVETTIYHHLRPAQMSHEGLPTRRAVFRYFRDTANVGIDVLFLALADYLATVGPRLDIDEWRRQTGLLNYVLDEHNRQEDVSVPIQLIDGHDIMDLFRLKPGPRLGELLSQVREAYAAGEITSREEALDLVRRHLAF